LRERTTRTASANAGGLGYDVPPGYVQERNGETIILSPSPVSERTPCVYGIAPTRPAPNNPEADAEAALLQAVVPGFRKLDDRHSAMRGVSAAGWPYVWYRAAFEGDIGGQRQAAAFDLTSIRRGEMADPPVYAGDIIVVDGSETKEMQRQILNTLPILNIFRPF
jgi:hypothetical protein